MKVNEHKRIFWGGENMKVNEHKRIFWGGENMKANEHKTQEDFISDILLSYFPCQRHTDFQGKHCPSAVDFFGGGEENTKVNEHKMIFWEKKT